MKKIFLLLFATIIEGQAFALIFQSGVLYYNTTSDTTVAVYSYKEANYPFRTSIDIPDKVTYNDINYVVTSIGNSAFGYCSRLTTVTIPNTVTSIGANSFWFCGSLTSINIPNTVTSIGNSAFYDCNNLQYSEFDNAFYLGNDENPYFALIKAKSNDISTCEINANCKWICDYAFQGLSSLTIPNSVTGMGENAFYNVKNVIYSGEAAGSPWGALTINGIVEGDFIYSDTQKTILTAYIGESSEVTIPKSVTKIGDKVFLNCDNLTTVSIPNSVLNIGNEAFSNCSALTDIVIPNSVTSIGEDAFYACSSLISVSLSNSVTNIRYRTFYNCTSLTSVEIPNSVTSIGEEAFCGCSNVLTLTIPHSVTDIGNDAFKDCNNIKTLNYSTDIIDNLFANKSSIETINIGDSATSIVQYAFYGCTGLKTLCLPNSINSIGLYAFGLCNNLETLTFNTNAVGKYFRERTSIKTINIGDSVTEIVENAFIGCKGLITINVGKSISSIGRDAFKNCDKIDYNVYDNAYYIGNNDNPYVVLMKVKNKGITSCSINDKCNHIYQNAFENCSDLKDLIIPNTIISIGSNAFSNCSGLTTIYIPNSVISINDNAFTNCRKMTSINIPNSVIEIGANAFKGCDGLKTATIGNSATSIGNGAFLGCSNLASVIIGHSVKSVGENAFNYCDNLKHIICLGTEPAELAVDPFLKTDTIYVPAESVDTYKAATYWKRKEILPFGIVSAKSEDETVGMVQGESLLLADHTLTLRAIPANGYHFVKWSDNNTDNPRVYSAVRDTSFTAIFEAHTVVTDSAVAATCSASGLTEGSHCSVCGDVIVAQTVTQMIEHTAVVDVAVAATANETGLTEGSHCSVCGAIIVAQEVIPALGEQGGGNEGNPSATVAESATSGINIYAQSHTIVVENAADEILVYDAMGRLVGKDDVHTVSTINVDKSGVYIVRIGNNAKRVFVNW
jgi:hypothetical protein